MFGIDLFMVLGIAHPKTVNKKTFQLKAGKHIIKGEKGARGIGGKEEKGWKEEKGVKKNLFKYNNKVKCC